MKKVLAVMSLFLMGANLYAVDQWCINGGNCPGGVNQAVTQSTPVFTAIQFVDGTTQTTAGGAGGGGGGASFFTFTENTGNKTAISSMTFETPQWSNTTTGSSTTVRLNPSSATQYGPFTSLNLTNPTTVQTSIQWPNLSLNSINAYTLPLVLGNNAAGTDSGIGFKNGITTHAVIVANSNTSYMRFDVRGKSLLTLDAPSGSVGINTTSPLSGLHVSSSAGSTSSLLLVSTGGVKLFEVSGTSVVAYVPVISRYGVEYSTSSSGGGGGSTPDNGFTLAQSTINSKLDNLIAGASFYIQNSTSQTSGVFHISSGTVESTLTVKGGLIMGGNGASSITPVGGTVLTIAGDLAFPTTWYTGVSFPFDAGSSSRVVSGSLYGQNGRFLGDGQQSSGPAVCGYFQKWIPQNYVAGSTPTFTDLVELSTGLLSQQTQWLLDFATSSVVAVSTGLAYSSQIAVTVTGTTSGSGGIRMQTTDQTIPGLTNILGSGEKFLIVRARRDGANALAADPAQSDTAIGHIGFAIKMQQ